jgi:hypothetical protein
VVEIEQVRLRFTLEKRPVKEINHFRKEKNELLK